MGRRVWALRGYFNAARFLHRAFLGSGFRTSARVPIWPPGGVDVGDSACGWSRRSGDHNPIIESSQAPFRGAACVTYRHIEGARGPGLAHRAHEAVLVRICSPRLVHRAHEAVLVRICSPRLVHRAHEAVLVRICSPRLVHRAHEAVLVRIVLTKVGASCARSGAGAHLLTKVGASCARSGAGAHRAHQGWCIVRTKRRWCASCSPRLVHRAHEAPAAKKASSARFHDVLIATLLWVRRSRMAGMKSGLDSDTATGFHAAVPRCPLPPVRPRFVRALVPAPTGDRARRHQRQ